MTAEQVEAFRERPLEGRYPYLFLDAKVEKVRDGGRVVRKCLVLKGTPEQLAEALARFEQVGVGTVALQFMAPRYPERLEQIERFATEALPRLSV